MMTFVSGRSSRISRQASTPLPSGRRMSMITTSGWAWRAILTASWAVPASPTTAKPGRRSRSVRRPMRTTSWSSTMRMLTVPSGMALFSHAAQGEFDPHLGAAPGDALHGEAGAQATGALLHVAEPAPVGWPFRARVEADAVVSDLQPYRMGGRRQLHAERGRLGVAGHVAQRLLGDAEQRRGLVLCKSAVEVAFECQLGIDESVDADALYEVLEGRLDVSLPHIRTQIKDVAPDVLDHLIQIVHRLLKVGRHFVRPLVQTLGAVLQPEHRGVYRLDGAVVEVHANALPLFQEGQVSQLLVEPAGLPHHARPVGEGLEQLGLALREARALAVADSQGAQHFTLP